MDGLTTILLAAVSKQKTVGLWLYYDSSSVVQFSSEQIPPPAVDLTVLAQVVRPLISLGKGIRDTVAAPAGSLHPCRRRGSLSRLPRGLTRCEFAPAKAFDTGRCTDPL